MSESGDDLKRIFLGREELALDDARFKRFRIAQRKIITTCGKYSNGPTDAMMVMALVIDGLLELQKIDDALMEIDKGHFIGFTRRAPPAVK